MTFTPVARLRPLAPFKRSTKPFQIGRYSSSYTRPGPPPLPRQQQREFEELQKAAQTPLAGRSAKASASDVAEAELALHPDARRPLPPTFEGDVNPKTGEQGGPKREPVGRWSSDTDGDWSFKGRVSDF